VDALLGNRKDQLGRLAGVLDLLDFGLGLKE
jgi:hypothetical protein